MEKPTLLFVEEYESTLSRSVVSNRTINLVLIRFKQNTFFSQTSLLFILNLTLKMKMKFVNELIKLTQSWVIGIQQ